jgi:hypothetical protein
MSNFLAIATVTETLRFILQPAVSADVNGATVKAVRPDGAGNGPPNIGVSIYLYQVTPNATWQNADLPTFGSGGQLVQRPRVALDLNYLLTFYGDEGELEPQRCLGSVARTLHAEPVLKRSTIRRAIDNTTFLRGKSNLDEQVELVRFTPLPLSLEELSKLWSVFFQTPYALSVAYHGTVVLIEGEEEPQAPLPVLERNLHAVSFRQPVIERITSQAGPDQPITAESAVILRGKQLSGDITEVRVGGLDPPEQRNLEIVSESEISLQLPAGLRAGVQGAQVIHSLNMGTPAVPHRSVESNVAAFVLHPIIKKKANGEYEIEVTNPQGGGDDPRSADLTVKFDPQIGKNQRVTLELLSGKTVAYLFAAAPLTEDTDEVTFHISGVKAETYLVRVRVDGAESPLDGDENNQPTAPRVTIP